MIREQTKRSQAKHREQRKAAQDKRRRNDPEAWNAIQRKSRAKHKDRVNATAAKWRAANIEKIRERDATLKRERYNKDLQFKMKHLLRAMLCSKVRYAGATKIDSTMSLAGCTPLELIAHLESQFYGGMTWADFGRGKGTFQIDHIIACGLFDLTDPKQQRRCFHYTNLQPLWHDDHAIKTAADIIKIRERNATIHPQASA